MKTPTIVVAFFYFCHQVLGFSNVSALDDYYLSYDYDSNSTSPDVASKEMLLLPVPEAIDSKYTLDVLPNVELPDNSLADSDLKDHDFIDNLMYVYYGNRNSKTAHGYGPEIIVVGCILSCAAQLSTIFCLLIRKGVHIRKDINGIFVHLMICLFSSNLFFVLGIYAPKSDLRCEILAVVLHYFHLLTALWIFLYCYYVYKRHFSIDTIKLRYLFSSAYGLPALITLISFVAAPKNYETKKFCFLSVQRGMIVNYMFPVSVLIIATTVYCLSGIRKANLELSKFELTSSAESLNALRNEIEQVKREDSISECRAISLRECKSCLKILCVVQTGYDIVWFIAVLALENINYSNSMSVIFSFLTTILNWYIFARSKSFLPSFVTDGQFLNEFIMTDPEKAFVNSRHDSSDSIPLLINSDNATEMKELHRDYISTISS